MRNSGYEAVLFSALAETDPPGVGRSEDDEVVTEAEVKGDVPAAAVDYGGVERLFQHLQVGEILERAGLTERERSIINLYYFKDLSDPQIAAELNAGVTRIGTLRRRALAKMRRQIIGK